MTQHQPPADVTPRAPSAIGHDLKANFSELWESVRERAVHTFDKLHRDQLLGVKSFDEFKQLVKSAYSYDDARVDTEIDRFVNEGGTPHTPHR